MCFSHPKKTWKLFPDSLMLSNCHPIYLLIFIGEWVVTVHSFQVFPSHCIFNSNPTCTPTYPMILLWSSHMTCKCLKARSVLNPHLTRPISSTWHHFLLDTVSPLSFRDIMLFWLSSPFPKFLSSVYWSFIISVTSKKSDLLTKKIDPSLLWTVLIFSMLLPLVISLILKADDFQNNAQPWPHASPLDSYIQLSTRHLHSDIWQPILRMSTAQLLIPSYPPSPICFSLSLLHLTQWQFYHSIFSGQTSLKFSLTFSFSLSSLHLYPHQQILLVPPSWTYPESEHFSPPPWLYDDQPLFFFLCIIAEYNWLP